MEELKRITKEGGYIALSGILDEKAPIVLEAINRCHLQIVHELNQEQWVGYVVRH